MDARTSAWLRVPSRGARFASRTAMKAFFVSLAAAACGHSSPTTPDGGVMAGSDQLTVHVGYDIEATGATVRAGATVLFYDAAGALLDRQVTGTDGEAIGLAAPGGTVTAVPPAGTNASLFSWVDIAPGDHLYTPHATGGLPESSQQSFTLPRDGNADVYTVSSIGLSGANLMPPTAGLVTVTGERDADIPPTADLVASASHPDGHDRFLVMHDARTTGAIDLSSSAWSDPTLVDLAIDNIAADVRGISVTYALLDGPRTLWTTSHYENAPGATLPLEFESPGQLGDGIAVSMVYQRGSGGAAQFWDVSLNGPAPAVDLAALLPPDAASVAVAGATAVTWTASGDPTRAIAVWVGMDTGAGGAAWTAILPADRRSFAPPPLPPDLAAFTTATEARVRFVGGNDPAAYAAIRTDPHALDPEVYATIIPTTPGMYRIGGI
jgi:hypothetical protein